MSEVQIIATVYDMELNGINNSQANENQKTIY
jgi:hypothetical protein